MQGDTLAGADRRVLLSVAGLAVLAASLLGACGGSATGSSSSPTASTSTDTRTIQADPSFSSTIQEVFERRGCTGGACHGASTQAGLNLQRSSAYANLVGVAATQEPITRVIAGNPDGSYLVIKLEGRQNVGVRMPQTGAALDNVDLTNIRNWIAQGARNN